MTPDLLEAFTDAMGELEEALDALDRHGPAYLRSCLSVAADPHRHYMPRKPPQITKAAAVLLRELADDAYVRSVGGRA